MKSFWNQTVIFPLKKFFSKKRYYVSALLVIVLGLFSLFGGGKADIESSVVVRKDVVRSVEVTGKTRPVQSVSLSFERIGKTTEVSVAVGDRVSVGQVLLRLDSTADVLALAQERASLDVLQAELLELEKGTRKEDMVIFESKVETARDLLARAKQDLLDTIKDSYTKADDAVRNYADQFFDNPRSPSPQLNIPVNDNQLKIDLQNLRRDLEPLLVSWQYFVSALMVSADLDEAASYDRVNLNTVKSFLEKLALAVNALSQSQSLSLTTINTYRAHVSTARSDINTALGNLSSDEEALTDAASDLDLARKNLALANAGTVQEKVLAKKAQVRGQEAKIASIRHQINISVLRSPIDGVVTKQDGKVGEVVAANKPLVFVASEGRLEIEAFVPEVNIGVMQVGNPATVEFDAFPSETFQAFVSYIEPAETVIDGVQTYKIKLTLPAYDERLRSGMTVTIAVEVARRDNVVAVPYRAVYLKDGAPYVKKLLQDGNVEEVPVELGIRGAFGEVEVLYGMYEGDTIVVSGGK